MRWISLGLTGLLACALCLPASAEYVVARSVMGCGGSPGAGGAHIADGTAGQPCIGVLGGTSFRHHAGFWPGPPVATDAPETPGLPAAYDLGQNYPNPFNPKTSIRYAVPKASWVSLTLYDVGGREVERLVARHHEPGWHELELEGGGLSSGVYFYVMKADGFTERRKLVLLK